MDATIPLQFGSDAVNRLRRVLQAERRELVQSCSEFEQMLSDDSQNAHIEITEREEIEVVLRNQQDAIDAIDVALGLMDDGLYGRCTNCGSAIPFERLEALPAATTCVTCQEVVSNGQLLRRASTQ